MNAVKINLLTIRYLKSVKNRIKPSLPTNRKLAIFLDIENFDETTRKVLIFETIYNLKNRLNQITPNWLICRIETEVNNGKYSYTTYKMVWTNFAYNRVNNSLPEFKTRGILDVII